MRNDEQEKQILQKLIKRFGTRWEAQAKKAMERLYEQIEAGTSITKAVATLRKEYSELFKLDGLQDMMTEAACYGYGIMPSVLTSTQHAAWGAALATSWDASGMTLSEKIHGAGVKMRGEIIRTLQTQMQRNKTWLSAARALYDGYSGGKNGFTGGKDIIQEQEIPKYLQKVLAATNDSKAAVVQRQALQNINRLARNGAPNKALQAAYNELLETVKEENSKALYKAVRTAIHEKSRYVAERIVRTEMARAYADGFIAKISKDEDIVAVKFKLSGRHPTFDICDMYAKADMFGLGKGIYPKDKLPPLPIHPHCLCHYSEIIAGEVDIKKSADHVRAAGDRWLNGLSERQRRQALGIEGAKAWHSGKDWRKYMRGYSGLKDVGSRLGQAYKSVILNNESKTEYDRMEFKTRKIKNSRYNMYLSENAKVKPKTFHDIEGWITKSLKLLKVETDQGLPTFIIANNKEIGGALGRYTAKSNKLYLNCDAIKVKGKPDEILETPLGVMLHELIHWKDAREYIQKYGEITSQEIYIEYIITKCKKDLDMLVQKGYSIDGISRYANSMRDIGRYDEVMTEYRAEKLLRGE